MNKKVILGVAALVLLPLAWWLGSPLFLDREVAEAAPSAAESEVLFAGSFRDFDAVHKGSGVATILQVDGERIVRFEDFEATNGPDLFVLVSPASEVADSDALEAAGWVNLGALKGNIGSQNYMLPADLELADVGSVIIWCRAFNVIFSVASLSAT